MCSGVQVGQVQPAIGGEDSGFIASHYVAVHSPMEPSRAPTAEGDLGRRRLLEPQFAVIGRVAQHGRH
jgi:hypothetical protein